jgi:cysteine desulfurase
MEAQLLSNHKAYLDHSASNPVDSRIIEAMMPYFKEHFGNPSSTHSLGQEALEVLEESREHVANLIGAKPSEIIFTSGATESINMAIRGAAFRNRTKGDNIVYSAIEHMAVLNTTKYLVRQGFRGTSVPVDSTGLIDEDALSKSVRDKAVVASVMYANGEIGTIEPVREAAEIVHETGALLHVDAVAAVGQIPIDVKRDGMDFLTISSNDLYGPKGVGALYIKEGTKIEPLIQGGGQEKGLRSGTENIPGIVGMAKAAEIAKAEMELESKRLIRIRDRLIEGALNNIRESYLNGHRTQRLPNNANIRFSYIEGESLILSLDMEGIQVSSASACTSKTLEPSHVLMAIGLKHEEAHGSLAFTFGRENVLSDADYVLSVLPAIVKRLRMISPLTPKELLL